MKQGFGFITLHPFQSAFKSSEWSKPFSPHCHESSIISIFIITFFVTLSSLVSKFRRNSCCLWCNSSKTNSCTFLCSEKSDFYLYVFLLLWPINTSAQQPQIRYFDCNDQLLCEETEKRTVANTFIRAASSLHPNPAPRMLRTSSAFLACVLLDTSAPCYRCGLCCQPN